MFNWWIFGSVVTEDAIAMILKHSKAEFVVNLLSVHKCKDAPGLCSGRGNSRQLTSENAFICRTLPTESQINWIDEIFLNYNIIIVSELFWFRSPKKTWGPNHERPGLRVQYSSPHPIWRILPFPKRQVVWLSPTCSGSADAVSDLEEKRLSV